MEDLLQSLAAQSVSLAQASKLFLVETVIVEPADQRGG